MNKFLSILLVILISAVSAEAKTSSKRSTSKHRTSSPLAVNKGEVKRYGDYLTTQMFIIKKGKDSEIKVEYPISGNPQLVKAIRYDIKKALDDKFTGSLDTPDALLRSALKYAKDTEFGDESFSLQALIKIDYNCPRYTTYNFFVSEYAGGAHDMYAEWGTTYLNTDGQRFTLDMLPPFSSLEPYILEGIAKSFDTTVSQLGDYLYSDESCEDYGAVSLGKEDLIFYYQPYEIAPWSAGLIISKVWVSPNIMEMLSPTGRKFFTEPADGENVVAPPPPSPSSSQSHSVASSEGQILVAPEMPPVFPGGMKNLPLWISENLIFPEGEGEPGMVRRVIVRFVINADGSVSNPEVVKGVSEPFNREAVRLVESMPRWTPGIDNGRNVRSYYTLPITFKYSIQ